MRIDDMPFGHMPEAAHLLDRLTGLTLPEPTGYHLLVLQYVRPDRTAGGVMIPLVTQKEDIYQGRIGLVLAAGDQCYRDVARFGAIPWCKPGDWVVWPAQEAAVARFSYGAADKRVTLSLLADDRILAVGVRPEFVG